jgi:hypothetical protein
VGHGHKNGSGRDGLGIRRPRGRLRKRNTIRGFRKYYNFSTENNGAIYDRDRILELGYTVGQAWGKH